MQALPMCPPMLTLRARGGVFRSLCRYATVMLEADPYGSEGVAWLKRVRSAMDDLTSGADPAFKGKLFLAYVK